METRAVGGGGQLGAGGVGRPKSPARTRRKFGAAAARRAYRPKTPPDPRSFWPTDVHVEEHLGGDGGVPGGQVALQQEPARRSRPSPSRIRNTSPPPTTRRGPPCRAGRHEADAQAVRRTQSRSAKILMSRSPRVVSGRGTVIRDVRRAGDGRPRHVSRELAASIEDAVGGATRRRRARAPRERARGEERAREESFASNGETVGGPRGAQRARGCDLGGLRRCVKRRRQENLAPRQRPGNNTAGGHVASPRAGTRARAVDRLVQIVHARYGFFAADVASPATPRVSPRRPGGVQERDPRTALRQAKAASRRVRRRGPCARLERSVNVVDSPSRTAHTLAPAELARRAHRIIAEAQTDRRRRRYGADAPGDRRRRSCPFDLSRGGLSRYEEHGARKIGRTVPPASGRGRRRRRRRRRGGRSARRSACTHQDGVVPHEGAKAAR